MNDSSARQGQAAAPVTVIDRVRAELGELAAECALFPLLDMKDGKCTCNRDTCPAAGKHPGCHFGEIGVGEHRVRQFNGREPTSYGIRTGASSHGIFAIDCDVKPVQGIDGLKELARLGSLPRTRTHSTPTGGKHFLLRAPAGYVVPTLGTDPGTRFARGVDIRGEGNGFIVAPGCPHKNGGTYKVDDPSPVADAPQWVLDQLACSVLRSTGARGTRKAAAENAPMPPLGKILEHCEDAAIAWCQTAEPSLEGDGGSNALMRVASRLMRKWCLPLETAHEIVSAIYNPRCQPEWSDDEITHKLEDARDNPNYVHEEYPDSYLATVKVPWGTKARASNDPAPKAGRDRVLIITGTDLHRVEAEAAASLESHPDLYVRVGKLVRVGKIGDTRAKARTAEGTPRIHSVSDSTLKGALTLVGDWKTWKAKTKNEIAEERAETSEAYRGRSYAEEKEALGRVEDRKLVATTPPDDVVAMLQARGRYPVPELAGIVETPSMRPDGTILQTPGFDEATGFFYSPGETVFPTIPDAPTQEEARRALAVLADVFADFPYVGAGKLVPIAHVLTLLARPAIEGCTPVFCYDAPTRGSGKTLSADVASIIATGRRASVTVYPREDEEIRKIIDGYAMAGVGAFLWDNVPSGSGFGSAAIDAALTSRSVEVRVLGKTGQHTCEWWTVMSATGNNFTFRGDTSRRALVARLESLEENPENKPTKKRLVHPERWGSLPAWVLANRPALVAAGLTVLRGYVAARRPGGGSLWGGFEEWARLVARAVVWAGGEDPQLARPDDSAAGVDQEKDALRTIVAQWPRPVDGPFITVAEWHAAKEGGGRFGQLDPDLQDAIDTLVPPRPGLDVKRALGKAFTKLRGRPVDGKRLASVRHSTKNVASWRVETVK